MAIASADDETNLNSGGISASKERLEHCCDDPLSTSGALVAEGRGDADDVSVDAGDRELSDPAGKPAFERERSNLFADEGEINGGITAAEPSGGGDAPAPPASAFASGGLSLMASSPPSPDSAASLENVDIGGALPLADDFAVNILRQIDRDEDLARQLQEEENKFKWKKPTGSKPRPVASIADSLFGEPLAWEVTSSYTRVKKDVAVSGCENSDLGVSRGLSMFTKSFKKWGSGLTAAATEFFGEDVQMQRRSSKNSDGQYRNAV